MQRLLGLLMLAVPSSLAESTRRDETRRVENRKVINTFEFHLVRPRTSVAQDEFHLPRHYDHLRNTKETTNTNAKRLLKQANDDDDATGEPDGASNDGHEYLTTCIAPFRESASSQDSSYIDPYGDIKVTFQTGPGSFYNKTNGQYPGYNPDWEFVYEYDLEGLREHCRNCKIQINEGDSCDAPLIRLWNRAVEGAYNPWRLEYGAVYNSNSHGKAKGEFSMFNGYDYRDNTRRTAVIFDQDKEKRIGCGILRRMDLGACKNHPRPSAVSPTSSLDASVSPIPTTKPAISPTEIPAIRPTEKPEKPAILPTEKPVMPPTSMPVIPPTAMPTLPPTETPLVPPTLWPTTFPVATKSPIPFDVPNSHRTERPHHKPNLPPDMLPPSYYPPSPTCSPIQNCKDKGGKGKGGKGGKGKGGKGKGATVTKNSKSIGGIGIKDGGYRKDRKGNGAGNGDVKTKVKRVR